MRKKLDKEQPECETRLWFISISRYHLTFLDLLCASSCSRHRHTSISIWRGQRTWFVIFLLFNSHISNLHSFLYLYSLFNWMTSPSWFSLSYLDILHPPFALNLILVYSNSFFLSQKLFDFFSNISQLEFLFDCKSENKWFATNCEFITVGRSSRM